MSTQRVPLSSVTSEPLTWDPRGSRAIDAFRYIDISSVDSLSKSIRLAKPIASVDAPSRARQLVLRDDVLVSTVRPNLNAVAIVTPDLDGAIASTGFAVLRPDPTQVEPRYLYHWVRSPLFVRLMTDRATGASYPAVTEGVIRESKLPLPPLTEQRRIADLLDRADAIRRKQLESLRLLSRLPSSVFVESFGSQERDPNNWPVAPLGEVAEIVSGVTKGRRLPTENLQRIPYLRVANVQDGYLDLEEMKVIDATDNEIAKYRLLAGDIVLTEGGDPDKLGRGAVWTSEVDPCIHQNHIFRVRLRDSRLAPAYVSALMGSAYGKRYFLKAAKQTTGIASINKTQLSQFPVRLPPRARQLRFEGAINAATTVTVRMRESLQVADELISSLAAHVFGKTNEAGGTRR